MTFNHGVRSSTLRWITTNGEKWRQPKKPLCAESGEGCAAVSILWTGLVKSRATAMKNSQKGKINLFLGGFFEKYKQNPDYFVCSTYWANGSFFERLSIIAKRTCFVKPFFSKKLICTNFVIISGFLSRFLKDLVRAERDCTAAFSCQYFQRNT